MYITTTIFGQNTCEKIAVEISERPHRAAEIAVLLLKF